MRGRPRAPSPRLGRRPQRPCPATTGTRHGAAAPLPRARSGDPRHRARASSAQAAPPLRRRPPPHARPAHRHEVREAVVVAPRIAVSTATPDATTSGLTWPPKAFPRTRTRPAPPLSLAAVRPADGDDVAAPAAASLRTTPEASRGRRTGTLSAGSSPSEPAGSSSPASATTAAPAAAPAQLPAAVSYRRRAGPRDRRRGSTVAPEVSPHRERRRRRTCPGIRSRGREQLELAVEQHAQAGSERHRDPRDGRS